MLLQKLIVLLIVIPMKVANFTKNIYVCALRALDIYSEVYDKITGMGQALFRVNLAGSFQRLAACVKKENIYIYIYNGFFQCLSSVTPKSRRKGSFCLLFHLFTLPHTN
jgi:hypothetical protein